MRAWKEMCFKRDCVVPVLRFLPMTSFAHFRPLAPHSFHDFSLCMIARSLQDNLPPANACETTMRMNMRMILPDSRAWRWSTGITVKIRIWTFILLFRRTEKAILFSAWCAIPTCSMGYWNWLTTVENPGQPCLKMLPILFSSCEFDKSLPGDFHAKSDELLGGGKGGPARLYENITAVVLEESHVRHCCSRRRNSGIVLSPSCCLSLRLTCSFKTNPDIKQTKKDALKS